VAEKDIESIEFQGKAKQQANQRGYFSVFSKSLHAYLLAGLLIK